MSRPTDRLVPRPSSGPVGDDRDTTFTYRALRTDGSVESGSISAPNRSAASDALARRGLFPTGISAKGDASVGSTLQRDPGVDSPAEVSDADASCNPVSMSDPSGLSPEGESDCDTAPLDGEMRLAELVDENSTRGSGFVRRRRRDGTSYQHQGVDLAAGVGTPVHAVRRGTIRVIADGNDAGLRVYIDHGDGVESTYWHLSQAPAGVDGQTVEAGDVIGFSGISGNGNPATSGREAHLHFGARVDGEWANPLEVFTFCRVMN